MHHIIIILPNCANTNPPLSIIFNPFKRTMTNAINFLARAPSLGSSTFKTTRSILSFQPSAHLKLRTIRKDSAKHSIFISPESRKLRPYHVAASSDAFDDSTFEDADSDDASDHSSFEDAHSELPVVEEKREPDHGNSVTKTIREFYDCINRANVKRLGELLADECWFDDCSFPERIQGKQQVCNFFDKLAKAMGENVKFRIEEICEGDHVGCAIWHLEWKEEGIPFTRGCTFFTFLVGDKVVISQARVLIESPVKPGEVVVGLLELVRKVFDDYPAFTSWFLSSPQVLLRILVNIYNLLAAPFINPLLVLYTQVCILVYRWIRYIIGFLRFIAQNIKSK